MVACSEAAGCAECGALTGCHWCGSGGEAEPGCFPIGDAIRGCLFGASCDDECVRAQAEFVGYGSTSYVMACIAAFGTILLLGLCSSVLCSAFFPRSQGLDPPTGAYVEMAAMEEQETETSGAEGSDLFFSSDDTAAARDTRDATGASHGMMRKIDRASIARACRVFGCLSLGGVLTLVVILAAVSPQRPEFSVCNKSVEWSSLMDTFKKLGDGVKFRGRYNLVVSVMNPNKFDMTLEECEGRFHYESSYVGSYYFHPRNNLSFVVPAGSVNDLLILADLEIGVRDIASLLNDWARSRLVLAMTTDATVGVVASGKIKYTQKYFLPEVKVDLGQVDDKHCKCRSS